jgi:hypothetical protein
MRDEEQDLTPEEHEILAEAPADTTTPIPEAQPDADPGEGEKD